MTTTTTTTTTTSTYNALQDNDIGTSSSIIQQQQYDQSSPLSSSQEISNYPADPTISEGLEATYWLMKKRQWSRLRRGTFSNEKRGFSLPWLILFLVLYSAYLCLQLFEFDRVQGFILEFILMGFISVSMGLIVPRFTWIVRTLFLEAYATLYLFFIFDLYYKKQYYIPLVILGGIALIFTIACFFIYPLIQQCIFNITGALTVHKVRGEANRYTINERTCYGRQTTCIYEGPLVDGMPEGTGTWMDTTYQGELLSGLWEKGIPLGPFESMENDTRSLLVNLRIVYGTNGGGKTWLDRVPLHTGVAGVECCVSGHFFKGYPKVDMIKGPDNCQCGKQCTCIRALFENRSYRHIDDDKTITSVVVSVDRKHDTLVVSGHKPKFDKQTSITIDLTSYRPKKSLTFDENWISSQSNEGLLFIHGYDHDLKDAIKRFAQFLALGHFPNYLKPFVFNWPSSTSSLLYWCAHSIASDNDNHRDLQKFIESLGHAGIRTLHVMCHSMGSRFFLRSFSKVKKAFGKRTMLSPRASMDNTPVHKTLKQSSPMDKNKISLTNLILLNPDYEIETFKNDYDELRTYCSNITIYADHRDMAIKMAFKMLQKQNLGNNIRPISDVRGLPLDVDIVDTGDLDSNMSERHHSFFNINRLMVDDLHDLIVTGKRAEERTSRLKKVHDVYRFSILPSSVVVV
ncbi:hypothetical protein SAMD00019534_012080 [Acytostelium subglobosum LB1]|uniref:hypothetical protein n=1 Tax=Acytostelium subglobosum LB1 TaxID=1410327 RepID=UPI000644D5AC|nr:hypothetical protein SAMD00019534_012080 [Acytostelium subglobosum LB1]GAM18033.1 hypothetical protein SAMD00019534_012080 [Acytostelium subglobosum LB1]|eukprot:XP_012758629.1 hypothetical protein SAMD00019534_012080 [Acytostelium subglobosum LB1]